MDEQRICADTSVAEVLQSATDAQRVFIRNRTACVGCSLARFCSLRDVAATYALDLEGLIRDLRNAAAHTEAHLSQRSDL